MSFRNSVLLGVAFLVVLFVAALFLPKGGDQGELTVEQPWARAPAEIGLPAEVFFIVTNTTGIDDSLYEVDAAGAQMEEIARVVRAGVPTVYELAGPVRIPAKSQVEFKPGGLLVNLNLFQEPVFEGDTLYVTLRFQNAGDVPVNIPVLGPFSHGS